MLPEASSKHTGTEGGEAGYAHVWNIVEFFLSNSFFIIEFLFQVRARVEHRRPARRHFLLAAGRVPIY